MWAHWPLLVVAAAGATPATTAEPHVPELRAARIEQGITLDGRLVEPAWRQAQRVDEWLETAPGDNLPPRVATVAYLAYDDRYLYIGFDCLDPEPRRIRAPLGERDSLTGNMDHVGLLLGTHNDGRTASIFAASASAVQYDSVWDDVVGADDTAPDFYWETAAHVDERGWTLEMRIPFASLRYADRNPESWRILLYRIYPREFWTQMQSTSVPHGLDCWVCRSNPLRGLHDLPRGAGLVVAPYLSGQRAWQASAGPGTPLASQARQGDLGGDVKWTPGAGHAIDATFRPDFSQLESDLPQIAANERFALFFPEKRPFFLEGRELFSTSIQAISTRTLTSPGWGLRGTGRFGAVSYTALVVRDEGRGSVVLPGPTGSTEAAQDFRSYALLGRARRDLGRSFVSLLATAREIDGGAYNRVAGPDFRWRPGTADAVTGQLLFSRSLTPRRPELATEWDGRSLSGHALSLAWRRTQRRLDWTATLTDIADGFRADDGYVPQVGYRRLDSEVGWTFWPQGWLRKVRAFGTAARTDGRTGGQITQRLSVGVSGTGRWNSDGQLQLAFDETRSGGLLIPQAQLLYDIAASPARAVSMRLSGSLGQAIDFDNHRGGMGADLALSASIRPTQRLELRLNVGRRFVDVERPGGSARLFTARVDRLKATYAFTRRLFVRLLAQSSETRRNARLYTSGAPARSAGATLSGLLAYRLDWQTALFVGYGDERALSESDRLQPSTRQLFLKLSYAFQR